MRHLLAAVSTFALAGCVASPDYIPPAPRASTAAFFKSSAFPAVSTAQPEDRWWQLYDDSVLNHLIIDALMANTDIRVAMARLERARTSFESERADRLPQGKISASTTYQRLPAIEVLPNAVRERGNVDAGLDVSYEADLFGRIRREIEVARGDLGVAVANVDAVRVTVVADTTRAYADTASTAERLAITRQIVDLLNQSIQITNGRFAAGRASRLDIIRISALRDQRKAEIPTLEAARAAALFRLATLTGRTLEELPKDASMRITSLNLDRPIPIGDTKMLLARRPDIRAAEKHLAADTARIGVAIADLYPRISLSGSVGSTGASAGSLFGGGPIRWLAGPLISWAFINQERTRARIAAARADARASLAVFDGAVLRALEEVETALFAYSREIERHTALTAASDEAVKAVSISRARQHEGQIDFLAVLDAERSYADVKVELADSTARLVEKQIDLFRALGGSWAQTAQDDPKDR